MAGGSPYRQGICGEYLLRYRGGFNNVWPEPVIGALDEYKIESNLKQLMSRESRRVHVHFGRSIGASRKVFVPLALHPGSRRPI